MLDIKFVRENPEVVNRISATSSRTANWSWLTRFSNLIKRTERLSRRLRLSVLRETRSPNRSVLLWAREKRRGRRG